MVLEVQQFKNSMFLMGTVKLCFEELGHRNLTSKISALSCIVLSQRSARKFAHNSISACEFCKDLRNLARFGTFGRK